MLKNSKKEIIIKAVIDLLRENNNFESLKIADIAKRAGIGKGTVYEYFSSKEELLIESVLCSVNNEIDGFFEIVANQEIDFMTKTRLVIEHIIDMMDNNINCSNFMSRLDKLKRFREIRENHIIRMRQVRQRMYDLGMQFIQCGSRENYFPDNQDPIRISIAMSLFTTTIFTIISFDMNYNNIEKEKFIKEIQNGFINILKQ